MRRALVLALLLASCGSDGVKETAPDLETAAIERGLVRDPDQLNPVGLYARDTDRLCVVEQGDAYRIGAYVDYGDRIACNAAGSARRSGTVLGVDFGEGCTFDARFDGDRIVFPGRLPDSCARLCNARASLAGLDVARLSASGSEASAMRGSTGKPPCSTS